MQTPLLAARCGSGILKMIPVRFRSTTTTNTLRREAGPAGNFGGKKLRRKEGTLPCGRKQEQLCPGEPSVSVTGHRQRDSFWSPTFFPGQRAWHRNRHRFGWWIGTTMERGTAIAALPLHGSVRLLRLPGASGGSVVCHVVRVGTLERCIGAFTFFFFLLRKARLLFRSN
jgi:hypothetical protein